MEQAGYREPVSGLMERAHLIRNKLKTLEYKDRGIVLELLYLGPGPSAD